MHNAKGRSDLEVAADNRYWVIELKYVAKKKTPKRPQVSHKLSPKGKIVVTDWDRQREGS